MADAVTTQVLADGPQGAVMKFTNVSDGTGETAVLKVDVSALAADPQGRACTGVQIDRIDSTIMGMAVNVLWDATADVTAIVLGEGIATLCLDPPLTNNAGDGKTGDVMFSTIGASASDTYTIILHMRKHYG